MPIGAAKFNGISKYKRISGPPPSTNFTIIRQNQLKNTSTNSLSGVVDVSESFILSGYPSIGSGNIGSYTIRNTITNTVLYTIADPEPSRSGNPLYDVAVNESYAVIGIGFGPATNSPGNVYVYSTNSGSQVYNLIAPSSSQSFGCSVGISNKYIIVGDEEHDGLRGRALVYSIETGSLIYTLLNPNNQLVDRFGSSVDVTDDYAIVGAYSANIGGVNGIGAAYVFSMTSGNLTATLSNPYPVANEFGTKVSAAATTAIVSTAPGDSANVYLYNTSSWTITNTITNPGSPSFSADSLFANDISICNSYFIVGAPFELTTTSYNRAGYVYIYSTSTGSLLQSFEDPNIYGTPTNDNFGWSVAISENWALALALQEDTSTISNAGYVYVLTKYDSLKFNYVEVGYVAEGYIIRYDLL